MSEPINFDLCKTPKKGWMQKLGGGGYALENQRLAMPKKMKFFVLKLKVLQTPKWTVSGGIKNMVFASYYVLEI